MSTRIIIIETTRIILSLCLSTVGTYLRERYSEQGLLLLS